MTGIKAATGSAKGLLVIAAAALTLALSMTAVSADSALAKSDKSAPIPHALAKPKHAPVARVAGAWSWWGYRFDRYQTWAIATQPISWLRARYWPFGTASTAIAMYYKSTAGWARWQGKCLGITWGGGATAVGCP